MTAEEILTEIESRISERRINKSPESADELLYDIHELICAKWGKDTGE